MRYLTLFRFVIEHAYYADSRCVDFQIEPTPGTQKLLKDCRCVLRPLPNGIQVLVTVDDKNMPFIPLPGGPVFAFHLRLKNPDFSLFTDLDAFGQADAPFYTNTVPATGGNLSLVSRVASSTERFVVRQPASKEPFILSGQPLGALKTSAFVVDGLSGKAIIKSYDANTGAITVNSAAASPGTPFAITYPVLPRLERGVFADVEIKYDPTPLDLSASANLFRIAFTSKKARWKYYLITDKTDNKTIPPALIDGDKAIVFDPGGLTDLSASPDPTDDVSTKLLEQYPNLQHFRFISNALIPCQNIARKNIQFQLNGEKVINVLPNPVLQNYSMDARNATKEYTLYQIIKYFTH